MKCFVCEKPASRKRGGKYLCEACIAELFGGLYDALRSLFRAITAR